MPYQKKIFRGAFFKNSQYVECNKDYFEVN